MCAKKVNTLHLEPGEERLLAVAGGDGTVALWDIRKLGPKATTVASAEHANTCQSAFFAPDGARRPRLHPPQPRGACKSLFLQALPTMPWGT